jgi:uncharacterized repeat protein (TIGR04076 family)
VSAGTLPPTPRLRVVVDRVGHADCGMEVGDSVMVHGSRLSTSAKGFCPRALAAVVPVLAARQYPVPSDDWLVRKPYLSCPRAADGVVLRIEPVDDGPASRETDQDDGRGDGEVTR